MAKINPTIAIGIPTWGKASLQWAQAYRHLGCPLGSSAVEIIIANKPIAQARNEIMSQAIASGADFLFTLSDDVLVPGNAIIQLIQRMWDHPEIHLISGVYWTKGYPSHPYIWKGLQRGPYLDWKMGEFFPIEMAGCDCLMVRLSEEMKALGPNWFATDWLWEPTQAIPSDLNTEDFYFYTKTRQAGLPLWCDSAVQGIHEDRASGQMFGLTTDMPQAGGAPRSLPDAPDGQPLLIADLGAGRDTPYFGPADKVTVKRFDGDKEVRPDYRCDLRKLPVENESFDIVHARHVLEHFGREEIMRVLTEWTRILKIGGQLRIGVPNLLWAIDQIAKQESGEVKPDSYAWWQLYGRHDTEYDYHHNGFTPKRLRLLLERLGCFDDIVVEVENDINLLATAKKRESIKPFAISPAWDEIATQEGKAIPGLNQNEDIDAPAGVSASGGDQ